jgi:molecular chaperone HscA
LLAPSSSSIRAWIFAGRRMNRAIARAIEGRKLDDVEKTVEHALGIDAAHAQGASARGAGPGER